MTLPAWLRRHPFPVVAHFDDCLVLTYAARAEALQELLPPGLRPDTWQGHAFLAIALVRTRQLRPAGFPRWAGQDLFLCGYRAFARFRTPDGKDLRGLRILRSDTDRKRMVALGNLLTHYAYHPCTAEVTSAADSLRVTVTTPDGAADLDIVARLDGAANLPDTSPFPDWREARKFAGPLPLTFDAEPATNSIVVIEGQRQTWDPQPVQVHVGRATWLSQPAIAACEPRLAAAFHVRGIDYRWRRGRRISLGGAA